MNAAGLPTTAVRWELTAPVASFRDPLFPAVQLGLPFPPPSTVRGLLAACVGGYDRLADVADARTAFAYTFTSADEDTDLETWHPVLAVGAKSPAEPKPALRAVLIDAHLTLWVLCDDPGRWERRLRRPVWPLRLGRSQDLATPTRPVTVPLTRADDAAQGAAVVPDTGGVAADGRRYRVTTHVAAPTRRAEWGACVYQPDARHRDHRVTDSDAQILADNDQFVAPWPLQPATP